MNHRTIKNLLCLILLSFLTLNINAEGLFEYLQNSETVESSPPSTDNNSTQQQNNASTNTVAPIQQPALQIQGSSQLKNIIEYVVAGIVAAAMIIVILVIFLGKFLTSKEKKLIKELRMEAEENTEQIHTVATAILEQGKETTQITQTLRDQVEILEVQQQETERFSEEISNTSIQIKQQEQEINEVTVKAKDSMGKIQKYWDTQVNDTVDTINIFQHKLSDNINIANEGLERMNEQKELSTELLQDFLQKHNEQSALIDNHSEMSEKVSNNLIKAYDESNKLIDLLKDQQDQAERSFNDYSQRLKNFEEQAYEQFDTSLHIETIRRQEEQSHGLNNQIAKNLESLDYSKIVKISHTLDTTQNMFNDIHYKVGEARDMLDELKEIEEEIKLTADNVKNVAENHAYLDHQETETQLEIENKTEPKDDSKPSNSNPEIVENIRENTTIAITDYRKSNGDTSTPLSFFREIKKNSPK